MNVGSVSSSRAYTLNGSTISFSDVPTSSKFTATFTIDKMAFGEKKGGSLKIVDDKVVLDCEVKMAMEATATISGTFPARYIVTETTMKQFIINGAYGKFNPDIDMTDLGDTDITGVPSFLNDEGVKLDLYNPQVRLDITSTLGIEGFVSGIITAWKDGQELESVNVPEMKVAPEKTSKLCICATEDGIDKTAYDVVNVIAELPKLLYTIPDRITFTGMARANSEQVGRLIFGHEYEVTPKYNVYAPLAMGTDANIIYKDTIDGWNEDLSDYELTDETYILMTTEIENRVPAFLNVTAQALGIDGKTMSSSDIEITVTGDVIASYDGTTSQSSPLTITLRQKRSGAMKELDGVLLNIAATSSNQVYGITLNANRHFVIAKDINVKIVGRIIADMN